MLHAETVRFIADPEVSLGNAYGDLGNVDHQKELLEKALNIQDRRIPLVGIFDSAVHLSRCWRDFVQQIEHSRIVRAERFAELPSFSFDL